MITDKVVVITGGSGLLGREFVRGIVEHGGIAVVADIREIDIPDSDGKIDFQKTDIIEKEQIISLIDNISKKYGKIDALVNSAYPRNKNFGRDFLEVEYSDFCENLNMHLGGYFLACQCFIKWFLSQGYGNIVNVASVYGVIAPRFELYRETKIKMPVEYAAIKSAIIHLTRYMAKYLKGKNIRVNCISPGGIFDKQPKNFLRRYKSFCLNKGMLDKSDITGTLIFLLSDMSKYINGQNIIVDDGFTL